MLKNNQKARFLQIPKLNSIGLFLTEALFHLIPQFFYLSKEVSPEGQTLLLSWCLFSAACADSPAEEEGKRSNKRAEEKKGGNSEGGKQVKNKADKLFNSVG